MTQKNALLAGEGDAWYERNRRQAVPDRLPESDRRLAEVLRLSARTATTPTELLEIGCGEGARLGWLIEHMGWRCRGVDPSSRAVEAARGLGVDARNTMYSHAVRHHPFGTYTNDPQEWTAVSVLRKAAVQA